MSMISSQPLVEALIQRERSHGAFGTAEAQLMNQGSINLPKPEVLLLSTSLLTDRMFIHTGLLEVLAADASVKIWASSVRNPRCHPLWSSRPCEVGEFPEVLPFKEFPYNLLRRMNEFVWDFRQQPPSRLSMWRHIRNKNTEPHIAALRLPARLFALARAEAVLESRLEGLLLNYHRSPDAVERLLASRPTAVLTTGPFQFDQPGVAAAAKNLGIPTIAFIPSWDNLSTKNRLMFKYDAYIVWSEQGKRELHHFYPYTRSLPVFVVGAPQFDVFFQQRFVLSREQFCATNGLKPEKPIIVYAVGSPNFLQEKYGALYLAQRLAAGDLGDAQMIVRPHPIHDRLEMADLFHKFAPRVVLQSAADARSELTARSQDEKDVLEWVNTFRHADVVVNLASTVTVDAAIFDRPVVNLDYDPEPGQPNQALVKEVNHVWSHFKPIAESGGVWLVNDPQEMIEAIKGYLADPSLHREDRRWLTEYVCQYLDGRCGERMASAILDFMHQQVSRSAST
jgi:CDP-glycerol:poly(glycerophosphate) glycerophosphotransferase